MSIEDRLVAIERLLLQLIAKEQNRQWYSIEEFAQAVRRSAFTCRQWCRSGRVHAQKKRSGRGAHASWVISHEELLRYQRDGLLPSK